jgi:hypothetical protein
MLRDRVDNTDYSVEYAKSVTKEEWVDLHLHIYEGHEDARQVLSKIYDDCIKEADNVPKPKTKPKGKM